MHLVARLLALTILAITGSANAATWFAGEFLGVGVGPGAIAKGGAVTATANGTDAPYWNPAGLASTLHSAFAFEHAERFSGIVSHDVLSAAVPVHAGALGITVFRGAIDGIIYADSTILADPTAPLSSRNMPDPTKTRTFSNADYTLYLAYGRRLTKSFDLGVSTKLVRRTLDRTDAFGYGVDIGVRWNASPSFLVGVTARDITTTRVSWDNGRIDVVKPTIHIGGAYLRSIDNLSSTVTISAESVYGMTDAGYAGLAPWKVLRDNNPATFGAEYEWRDMLVVRVGTQDLRGLLGPGSSRLTAGIGIRAPMPWIENISRIGFDLSWAEHALNDSFRLGTSIEL